MSFKPGDVVLLKSGGPRMTVEKAPGPLESSQENNISTVWFTELGELKRDLFKAEVLSSGYSFGQCGSPLGEDEDDL